MAKPRKTGRAIMHTYLRLQETSKGISYEARVIDPQAHTDTKRSARTATEAIRRAKSRTI
jgi:hypothetical protein